MPVVTLAGEDGWLVEATVVESGLAEILWSGAVVVCADWDVG